MQAELAKLVETGGASEIVTLSDAVNAAVATMAAGGAPRIASGMASIDESVGGFGIGEMTLIAARPSMGKSLLAKQFADLVAQAGTAVGYVNCEETNEKLARNWLSRNAKIANQRVRKGQLTREEWAVVEEWRAHAPRVPLYCCERAMTLAQVCNVITLMVAIVSVKKPVGFRMEQAA